MGIVRLGLELPSSHETYYDYNGDSSSEPISGSIRLTAPTEAELKSLKEIRVSLVLRVSTSTEDETKQSPPISSRISRLMSLGSPNTKQRTHTYSVLEKLTLNLPAVSADARVGYSPETGIIYKVPFFIPVPANLPPTTVTEQGGTSLLIVAAASTADGNVIDASQELHVIRRLITDVDPVQHTRTYETSRAIRDVTLSQNLGQCTASKLSLSAKISLQHPTTPANRAMEFKCVAVRALQWRMEEVTRIFTKPHAPRPPPDSLTGCEPIEEASLTRELFHGHQRGYWGTADNPMVKNPSDGEKGPTIDIPLEIGIPQTVTPAPEVGLGCYEFDSEPVESLPNRPPARDTVGQQIVTVEHRLRLDVLLCEDCFRAQNKTLVDRKPLPAALGASFPIYIGLQASGSECLFPAVPPCYASLPASPPQYEL